MICPRCGSNIPDQSLACLKCLQKASNREILGRQRDYLPDLKTGRLNLRLAQDVVGSHLVAYGDQNLSYCGKNIEKLKRRPRLYDNAGLWRSGICGSCLRAFDKIDKALVVVVRETL